MKFPDKTIKSHAEKKRILNTLPNGVSFSDFIAILFYYRGAKKMYNVKCALYNVKCVRHATLYIVHYTLYIIII